MDLQAPEMLIILFLLGGTLFWIWMLIDCAIDARRAPRSRIVWLAIIALTYVPGALAYLVVRRVERRSTLRG